MKRFLERLGYLDDDMNCDMSEAISTFSIVGQNRRSIAALGVQINDSMDTSEKVAAVRKALVASPRNVKTLGAWVMASSDASVLRDLRDRNVISNANASSQTLLVEMQVYLQANGVKPLKSPRAVMKQVTTHINKHHPQQRK